MLWIWLFHMVVWLCWSHLIGCVLGMPYQMFPFSTTNKKVTHRLFYASIMIAQVNISKSLPSQRNVRGETNFRENLHRFWLKALKIEHNYQEKVYHFYSIFWSISWVVYFDKDFGNLTSVVLKWFVTNYRFANHVVLFEDTLTFQIAIAICCNWQTISVYNHIPSPWTWVVCEVVCKNFVTHCEGLCFELKLRALNFWGRPPFNFSTFQELHEDFSH